ncbi:tyrosine-protein phosphatase [Kitasatospora arboriphila]
MNARDLGGYRTADGRVLKPGTALRADALNRLGEDDLALLADHGLRQIVDLRSLDEVREAARTSSAGCPPPRSPPRSSPPPR